MNKRRHLIELAKDILEYCVYAPKRHSWITLSCRANSTQLKIALSNCIKQKLLEVTQFKKYKSKGYVTTEKGKKFVQKYYELEAMIGLKIPEEYYSAITQ